MIVALLCMLCLSVYSVHVCTHTTLFVIVIAIVCRFFQTIARQLSLGAQLEEASNSDEDDDPLVS